MLDPHRVHLEGYLLPFGTDAQDLRAQGKLLFVNGAHALLERMHRVQCDSLGL